MRDGFQIKHIIPLQWMKPYIDDEKRLYYFDARNTSIVSSSPLESAVKLIQDIANNYPPPYRLYLSGGVDSQAMLYAWQQSGIPYETYSARYNNNLNDHDISTIKQFAEIHRIKLNIVDFDLFNFLEKEHDFYATTYFSGSPQFSSFMKMVDNQIEGTALMSGNFALPTHVKKNEAPDHIGWPDTNAMSLYQFARISGKNFIPFFFMESPELFYSLKMNPYIQSYYDNTDKLSLFNEHGEEISKGRSFNYILKCAFYQSFGFPVLPQIDKYNGFEKVKDYYDQYEYLIKPKDYIHRLAGQKSKRAFDVLYRYKYEVKIRDFKYIWRK